MSDMHCDNNDHHGSDHGDHYYFFYGGDSNFSFSDSDGRILGWIAVILGGIFLISLLSL